MYPLAPDEAVTITSVQRTKDNQTVVAFWERLNTILPVGEVQRYEVEFRDFLPADTNTFETRVYVSSRFNYIVISRIKNADTYEV